MKQPVYRKKQLTPSGLAPRFLTLNYFMRTAMPGLVQAASDVPP